MAKKYVGEMEFVDGQTGEIIGSKKVFSHRSDVRYMHLRLPLNEVLKLPISELKVALLIAADSNYEDLSFVSSQYRWDKYAVALNLDPKTVRKVIFQLAKKNIVQPMGNSEYMVNPEYFFKGHTSRIKELSKKYEEIYVRNELKKRKKPKKKVYKPLKIVKLEQK